MTETDIERRRFEQVSRHAVELEKKVTQQEALIAGLDCDGYDTRQALDLLRTFRALLVQARIHERLSAEHVNRLGRADALR